MSLQLFTTLVFSTFMEIQYLMTQYQRCKLHVVYSYIQHCFMNCTFLSVTGHLIYIYQYSNMALRLLGQTSISWCFICSLLRIERQRNLKNCNFDPKAFEPYWNIDISKVVYCNQCILLLPIKEQLKAVQGLERDVASYKPQMDELELVHQVRKGALCYFPFYTNCSLLCTNFIQLFYFLRQ